MAICGDVSFIYLIASDKNLVRMPEQKLMLSMLMWLYLSHWFKSSFPLCSQWVKYEFLSCLICRYSKCQLSGFCCLSSLQIRTGMSLLQLEHLASNVYGMHGVVVCMCVVCAILHFLYVKVMTSSHPASVMLCCSALIEMMTAIFNPWDVLLGDNQYTGSEPGLSSVQRIQMILHPIFTQKCTNRYFPPLNQWNVTALKCNCFYQFFFSLCKKLPQWLLIASNWQKADRNEGSKWDAAFITSWSSSQIISSRSRYLSFQSGDFESKMVLFTSNQAEDGKLSSKYYRFSKTKPIRISFTSAVTYSMLH